METNSIHQLSERLIHEVTKSRFLLRVYRSTGNNISDIIIRIFTLISGFVQRLSRSKPFIRPVGNEDTFLCFILGSDWAIWQVNAAACRVLKYRQDSLIGKPFSALLADDSPEPWNEIRDYLKYDYHLSINILHFTNASLDKVAAAGIFFTPPGEQYILILATTLEEPPALDDFSRLTLPVRRLTDRKDDTLDIRKLATYIHEHSDEPLPSQEKLSGMMGTNRQKLKTKFREAYGKAIYEYYNEKRMNRACEYLVGSTLPVTEIAEKLGFRSPSAFFRAFRRTIGCTPGQYRKKAGG